MGRPREFDSDFVMGAATDCFWADGIARTSISSLVEAMKIQRSSFYNSFNSREDILATVLERYFDTSPLGPFVNASGSDHEGGPDLALIDLILDFAHFVAEDGDGRGCLFFNGLSELSHKDGQVYEIYHDYYLRLTNGLSDLLAQVSKEASSPGQEAVFHTDHILCILIGLSHYSKLDKTETRLIRVGLDQLSGLSPHFDTLIQTKTKALEASHKIRAIEPLNERKQLQA